MPTRLVAESAATGIALPELTGLILEGLREGVVATDADGNVVYANRASQDILGISLLGHDEASRRARTQPLAEDRKTPVPDEDAPLIRALKGEYVDSHTQWIKTHPDNREVLVTINATPLRNASGEISGALAWFRDITEARMQRERLERSEELYRAQSNLLTRVIEGLHEGVVVFDNQSRVSFANSFARQFLGASPEGVALDRLGTEYGQFDAQTGQELKPDDYAGAVALRGEPVFGREIIVRGGHLKEDAVIVQSAVPLLGRHGEIEGSILWFRDVTADKKAEKEKAEIAAKLVQAQKMEAVGQLTGGIAHDFNNLLTVIQLYADILSRESGDNDLLREAAGMVQGATSKAADLTHRLLAFSRKQDLVPKTCDVNDLISRFETVIARALGETIDLEFVIEPRLWNVLIDPGQLENAVLNLALNARDAMPDGGKLTIKTSNSRLDTVPDGHTTEFTAGDYVTISMCDTGVGMTAEVLDHAFEPFFTTKDVGAGSGLGLSMVYGFARQSGGYATIESRLGKGTTVRLHLPRSPYSLGSLPQQPAAEEQIPSGNERVALVEDDRILRPMLEQLLRELGYSVRSFPNGPALLQAMDGGYRFDVLQSDIVLPLGMNGIALAKEVRLYHPTVKTLFMSGYSDNAITRREVVGDRIHLLQKPFQRIDLAKRLRAVLDDADSLIPAG
jgi:PAS domain S-box-containing protein